MFTACPEAIFESSDKTKQLIDPKVCEAKAVELRAITLPKLLKEKEIQIAAVEEAREEVQEPLHRWAEAGHLTIKMIL